MGPMGHFVYTSDDGNDYRVRLDAGNAAIGSFGADDPTKPGLPKGFHMRYAWAERTADGVRRKIYMNDVAAALWTNPGGSVNLYEEGNGTAVAFVLRGKVGESRYAI